MTDILEYIKSWSALKWVILVLIAGFVGQFGRMTAEAIVKKIAARRAKKAGLSDKSAPQADSTKVSDSLNRATPPENSDRSEKLDKKFLKAVTKARKKEAKTKQ